MYNEEKILSVVLDGFDNDFINSLSNNYNLDDIDIFDDLGFDSIKFIQLIVDLESSFNIEFDENMISMDGFSKIKQIKKVISELTANK